LEMPLSESAKSFGAQCFREYYLVLIVQWMVFT
jgi:hypothetical protein